jgi:phosphatidylglycerophosphate synthase
LSVLVASETARGEVRVFGLNPSQRLARAFERAELQAIDPQDLDRYPDERVVALSAAFIIDERVVAALAARTQGATLYSASEGRRRLVGAVGKGRAVAGIVPFLGKERESAQRVSEDEFEPVEASDLVPAFDPKLRKHAAPVVVSAQQADVAEIERILFDAAYKGTTDFVTKWVWPRPARAVTAWCAACSITPNAVTAFSYVFTALTLVAFWQGEFVLGLASAWLMTFLDTVDGKLARVTMTSSTLGDVLDHGLDLIHPPFWWVAWVAGLAGPESLFGEYETWAAILFFGYIVGRLLEGAFILLFGQEMFNWRPFDRAFRLVIARRNPNLVILSVGLLLGAPGPGIIGVGIWTLACILIQCVRIAQAAIVGVDD